jgi:hypothetical protein
MVCTLMGRHYPGVWHQIFATKCGASSVDCLAESHVKKYLKNVWSFNSFLLKLSIRARHILIHANDIIGFAFIFCQ